MRHLLLGVVCEVRVEIMTMNPAGLKGIEYMSQFLPYIALLIIIMFIFSLILAYLYSERKIKITKLKVRIC